MFAGGVDKNWEYDFKIKAVVEQKRSDKLKIQQERKRKYEETIKDDVFVAGESFDALCDDLPQTPVKKSEVMEMDALDYKGGQLSDNCILINTKKKALPFSLPQMACKGNQTDEQPFPKMSVRTSWKNIKPQIIDTCVNLQAKHHVNASQCTPIIAEVANRIFGQDWQTEIPPAENQDYSTVLPSRRGISNAIEDSTIIALRNIGMKILHNREEGGINTLHFDDTVKKSGEKSFDVKTLLVTTARMNEGEKKKETLSLGFAENISHKGTDGAETIKNMLRRVAVLIGVPYEEFLDLVDYSMTDRGGDVNSLLDELGVEPSKRMNCNAHVLLCVDSCLNKTLTDFELKVGVHKLLGRGLESTHVLSSNESVWILGLIAFSKLLSPSSAVDTISLNKLYLKFLFSESKDIESELSPLATELLKTGFKKFVSNRFGRMSSLSKTFIQHKPLLDKFFHDAVDENCNKLWMASYCYLNSTWFYTSCKVASYFFEMIINPLMLVLGIDSYHYVESTDFSRSWAGVRSFFNTKLDQLQTVADNLIPDSAESTVIKQAALSIKLGVDHQLQTIKFFSEQEEQGELSMVPLTNSCAESNFGKLNYALSQTSGAYVSLSTVSNKNILQSHHSKFIPNLTEKENKAEKLWSRKSMESKEYKKLVREYQQKVKNAQDLVVLAKKEKKQVKLQRTYVLLDQCKVHGGPVSPTNLDLLENLREFI